MGPQGPPALRSVGLVAVTSLRAGPSYGLPGQAPEQRDWVKIQPATSSKAGQDSTGVDNRGNLPRMSALGRYIDPFNAEISTAGPIVTGTQELLSGSQLE